MLPALAGVWAFVRLRRYAVPARVALSLACSALAFVTIWAAILGAFYVALIEPWPLSLRQGPDTDYARACFERYFGEAPPPDVRDVHCREEWGFGGDSIESIRFGYADADVVERVAAHLRLVRSPDADVRGLRYIRGPAWWPNEAALLALPVFYRFESDPRESLWVDPDGRVAYWQQAGF